MSVVGAQLASSSVVWVSGKHFLFRLKASYGVETIIGSARFSNLCRESR